MNPTIATLVLSAAAALIFPQWASVIALFWIATFGLEVLGAIVKLALMVGAAWLLVVWIGPAFVAIVAALIASHLSAVAFARQRRLARCWSGDVACR